jgi:hypothetical protein
MKLFIILTFLVCCLSFEFSAELNNRHAIFISESKMKKHLKNNPSVAPTSTEGAINDVVSQNLQKNTNIFNGNKQEEQSKDKLDSQILYAGWVKFFKFNDNNVTPSKTPKTFEENNFYYEQLKLFPNGNMNEKDVDGKAKYIRDKNFFWMNLFKGSVNIISSKTVILFYLE